MRKEYMKSIVVLFLAIVSMIPSLTLCRYVYPVQDDFHYAYHARLLFEEGYNLFTMAWAKTVDYYLTFTGCYTSSFLGHFFSGIIQCNLEGIQWFCFISMMLFYISLYFCAYGITRYIFNINLFKINCIYCLLIFCFTGLIYYAENEDYYWFITSVQYLLITTCILFGLYLYIKGLYTDKKVYLIFAGIMGFLGSGGALNIAAMCFLFVSYIMWWGMFVLKKRKQALIVWAIVLVGGIINGIAPGNYIRHGEPVTMQAIIEAAIDSCHYALLRIYQYLSNPLFVFIILALVIGILLWKPDNIILKCRFPVLFAVIGFATIAVVIFPVMLGYGWDTYLIICRSNFISDTVIFMIFFVVLIYWRCWLFSHNGKMYIPRKIGIVVMFCFTIFACIILNGMWKKGTAFYRQIVELRKGTPQEYSAYWIDVYEEIEESQDDIVVLYREAIAEDKTCLINPQFAVGEYDYANSPLNRSIAQFYGKEAVFLFAQEANVDKIGE